MAKYPSISQTKNGRILIAKSNATGKALKPIKVVAGDGQLTNQNIETMENVINPLLELPFASPGRFVKEGQFQLDFALSNEHLEHGFYAREIGVFAKLDGEDDSTAVMIAYTNGGNFVDYIPAKDTPINSKVFELTIAVNNAANVIVQRSDAAYITAGEMERHNESEQAHDNRFNAIIQQVNNMITPTDDSDKQSLAPTLALVKTMLGNVGIVAQRLEVKGFVKFANGFTIQWGELTNGVSTFPVPFSTTVFFAVATSDTVNSTWSRPVIPMKPVTTLTGVSFTGYISGYEQANTWGPSSFNGRYFCIGI